MKKITLTNLLLGLICFTGITYIFYGSFYENPKGTNSENALITPEDLFIPDYHIQYTKLYVVEYYGPPAKDYSRTESMDIIGYYKKEENETFLSTSLKKYSNDTQPNLDGAKSIIRNNMTPDEEFTPAFVNSSFFEYKQCAKSNMLSGKQSFMCVLASIVNQQYIYSVVLHGNGPISNEELEVFLGNSIKNKLKVLDNLK